MSNYQDYFDKLSDRDETKNTIDFGTPFNHKNGRAKRNYFYRHPNQLRPMTLSHSKKVSHSKQNDLLGAIEMLTYKPPEILPISTYTAQVYPNTGKKKPFVISETENLNKKPISKTNTVVINEKTNKEKEMDKFRAKQKKDDALLQKLVNQGVAKVYPKQTPPKVIHSETKKPVELKPVVKKPTPQKTQDQLNMERFKANQLRSDRLLQGLVDSGVATTSTN
tara:strand:+ start:1053 stop:1718 length:666 start_codon:yes stop_codon:yes gene_type:complete